MSKIEEQLEKLELQAGDVIIWRRPPDMTTTEINVGMQTIEGRLRKLGFAKYDILVLGLPADHDLEKLDEEEMEKRGWVRKGRWKKEPLL